MMWMQELVLGNEREEESKKEREKYQNWHLISSSVLEWFINDFDKIEREKK